MKRKHFSYRAGMMLCLMTLNGLTYAQSSVEWLFEGGPSWFNTSRAMLSPTDIETDRLSRGHANPTGDLGLGVYYKHPLFNNNAPWLNHFGIGLEVRYSAFLNNIAEGTVFQFEQSDLNNYQYNLYFENTRLLAQLTLDVFTHKQFSLNFKGGIGGGWSRLGYHDYPTQADIGGGLSLFKRNTSGFVANIGFGLNYQYSEHLSYSLSYLYTNYGNHSTPSNYGLLNGEPVIVKSPSFSLDSQALLVGIHYSI